MGLFLIGQDFKRLFKLDGDILLLLALSVIFSITLGDFVYLAAQHYIGVSRAAPITNLTPLITLFAAFILLGEALTEDIFIGTLLVSFGVIFITRPAKSQAPDPPERKYRKLGFGLAFMTPLFWGGGYLVLRIAMSEIDTVSANVVRYFFAILFMSLVSIGSGSLRKIKTYRRQFKIVFYASFFNIMLDSLFWLGSIKYAGARTISTLAWMMNVPPDPCPALRPVAGSTNRASPWPPSTGKPVMGSGRWSLPTMSPVWTAGCCRTGAWKSVANHH